MVIQLLDSLIGVLRADIESPQADRDNQKGQVNRMNERNGRLNRRPASGSGRDWLIGILFAALVLLLLAVGQAGAAANSKPQMPQFISPTNGSTVLGTVAVIVYAPELAKYDAEIGIDNANWQPMQYRGDGFFQFKWSSIYVSNGRHTLTARFLADHELPPEYAVSIRVNVLNAGITSLPNEQAGILPLPCIDIARAFQLRPASCGAPATS